MKVKVEEEGIDLPGLRMSTEYSDYIRHLKALIDYF